MNYENELEKQVAKSNAELAELKKAKKLSLREEGQQRMQAFLDSPFSVLKISTQGSFNLTYDAPGERAWFAEGIFEPIDNKIECLNEHERIDIHLNIETGLFEKNHNIENNDIIYISYHPFTDDFMVYFYKTDYIYGRERLAKFVNKFKVKLDPSPIEEFRVKTYEYIGIQIAMIHQLNKQSGCE